MATNDDPNAKKIVATNRSARHDYEVLDTVEAGLVLRGSEVKSLREAQVQIKEAFARFDQGEAWLIGMHVSPWGTSATHDLAEPDRKRKLLLHREQISILLRRSGQDRTWTRPRSHKG
jgi:SsrA-binding protein